MEQRNLLHVREVTLLLLFGFNTNLSVLTDRSKIQRVLFGGSQVISAQIEETELAKLIGVFFCIISLPALRNVRLWNNY